MSKHSQTTFAATITVTTVAALYLVCSFIAANPANASLVRAFSLEELAREAHLVVVGQVSGSRSFYSDDGSVIYTQYSVEIENNVKGISPTIIEVRLLGGLVGETELVVAGNPVIENGERLLLFLRDYNDFFTVVGLSQGKWSLRSLDNKIWAFRGPALVEQQRVEGEVPLDQLLAMCGLLNARGGK